VCHCANVSRDLAKSCRFRQIWTPHNAACFGRMMREGGIVFVSHTPHPPPLKQTRPGCARGEDEDVVAVAAKRFAYTAWHRGILDVGSGMVTRKVAGLPVFARGNQVEHER
jgi:hypothetical protein